MVYGYIRVSTGKQTLENQKLEIRRYCKFHRLRNIVFVQETVSGTKRPEKRKLGNLIEAAKEGDIQRGFDTNEITRKLDGINYGMCDGFYSQNTNLLNGFNGVNSAIASEGRSIQTQMAECCCNTNRNIDSVRFDMANYAAQSNANTVAMTQKVLDALNQNKVDALQNRVNQLELQSAMCGVVRYPNSMAYNAGSSPFCNCGNGCGNTCYAYA